MQDLYESDDSAYPIFGWRSAIFTVQNPANYLRISLDYLKFLHRFTVRGQGKVGVGSSFGMSIHRQFKNSRVELFYTGTAHVFHVDRRKNHIAPYLIELYYVTFINMTYK